MNLSKRLRDLWRDTIRLIFGVWIAAGLTPAGAAIFPADLPLIVSMQAFPDRVTLGDPDVPSSSGIEGPKGIAEGDLRRDGTPDDVAVSNLDGTVTVLFGSAGGDFEKLHLRTGASSLRGILIADVDGNGTQDILTAAPFDGEVFVFKNLGNETFAVVETIPEARAHGVRNLAAADFDGDGRLDLALAGPGLGLRQLRGLGDGRFERVADLPQLSPVGVTFPKPVYSLHPVPALDGSRHDLAVMHAESDELFLLSTVGEVETATFVGKGGFQDLPLGTEETPLLITEFMAVNTRTLMDEEAVFSDWIEIYNRSDEPVPLGGWFLANHHLFQDVWQFPDTTLAPAEFIVVFASGLNRRIAGRELHANFRLSANDDRDTEALSLWQGGVRRHLLRSNASSPYYPEQVPDVSYGLAFNGKEQFFQIPSPGRINNRGYDSLGDVSLAEVVDWEAEEGPAGVRISVRFSDISRLSSVWVATRRGTTPRYWTMQAVDRENSSTYTTTIPARYFDPEAPLEIIARRKDGRIRPVTVNLEDNRVPAEGALRLVASLAARSARSVDIGRLLAPVDGETGVLDLVLSNRDGGYIQIHRGVPERHRFDPNPYASFQIEGAPRAVRIADVNGDGWNDLLVALRNADTLIVLRNEKGARGERIFVADPTLKMPVGSSPREIAVIDANFDGKQDGLVINRFSSDLSVLLTVEDEASFGKLDHLYNVDGQIAALTILDFNRDGRDDVVLTHRATGDFSVRLSNEDGTLGPPVYHAAGEEPNDTEFEDCDEDGDEDAIVALLNGQASIAVRLREPDGAFGPVTTYSAPRDVEVGDLLCVATEDFDGDGHADIAASYFDCRLTFFRGDGRGAFEAKPVNDFTDEPRDIIPGDFDGDGDADLATVNFSGDVVILENIDGKIMDYTAQEFALAKRVFPAEGGQEGLHLDARDVRRIDLNGDVFDDLIAATGNGVRFLLGRPSIAEMQAVSALGEGVEAMARADFDGNGIDDVAVACRERACVKFLAMEDGVLQEQASVAVPGATFLAEGDIDGDGEPDLVGVGDVLWTALSSRSPRPADEIAELVQRPVLSKPVINEILARNSAIPLLFDRDKKADYVELYNGAAAAISLEGWRLDLEKRGESTESYDFPPDLFEPKSHRIVVFSSTKRGPLHTGFKLPGDGATLVLRDAEGTRVDEVSYPAQLENIAYSRYQDGLAGFVFNPLPTPNNPNRDGGAVEPRLAFEGFDAASLHAGEPLRFTVRADDDIGIVSVWVTYLRLDRPQDGLQKLVLFDTGMHGDGGRGDAVYSNVLDTPLSEESEVQFYISALDLTGAIVTYPDDPVLALDGRSQDIFSIGTAAPLGLAITEVVSGNASLLGGEWTGLDYVELTNRGSESLSLEGISLADRFLAGPGEILDFSAETILQPGETLVVPAGGETVGDSYHAPFGISDKGDRLVLLGTAKGGARTVIDVVDVPPLNEDEAYNRVGDVWLKGIATPGNPNPTVSGAFYGFDLRGERVWTTVFDAEAGVRYEVTVRDGEGVARVVDEIEGSGGAVSISLRPGEEGVFEIFPIPPEPPAFEWEVVNSTKHEVEIAGRIVDTGGRPPALRLYYDTVDRGSHSDEWTYEQSLPGRPVDDFSAVLDGLSSGSRYVGRLVADNGSGPVWSDAVSFETLPDVLPQVGIRSVDDVTTIEAQCEVEIREEGRLRSEVTLFWGASDGGADPEKWEFSKVLGEGTSFEATLQGLRPGYEHFVRARASNGDGEAWSSEAVAFTTMTVLESLERYLIVSEFMYHPVELSAQETARGYRNSDFEWIELYNHGPMLLDLSEVSLRNAVSFDFAFDADVRVIGPGAYLTVVANRDAFSLRHGTDVPVAGQWCGPFSCPQLSNDGIRANGEKDAIVLAYRSREKLLEIEYRDDSLWPTGPDGKGVTLEVSPPGAISATDEWPSRDWSDPSAWQASSFIGGTPGSAAPPGAVEPAIRALREGLMVTRIGPFGDNEFLELTNISNEALDLAPVRIDDDVIFSFAGSPIIELAPGDSVYVVRNAVVFRRSYGSGMSIAGEFSRRLSPDGRLAITAGGVTLMDFVNPFATAALLGQGTVYRLNDPSAGLDPSDPDSWTGLPAFDKALPWFTGIGRVSPEPITVEFDPAWAGEAIQYTLDQTLPSLENGELYREPFMLHESAILMTRVGEGPVQTAAYVRHDRTVRGENLPLFVVDTLGSTLGSGVTACVLGADGVTGYAEISIHGESEIKPSFRIRLRDALGGNAPMDLLDLPADAEWLLEAQDPEDLSLLREPLAYQLSRQMGYWAPRTVFVDLYLNEDGGLINAEDYLGVYVLTETLERGSHRVDVEELAVDASQLPGITGGYFFRVLPEMEELTVEALYPPAEAPREPQQRWLDSYLIDLTSALSEIESRGEYPAYVDVDNWIDFHLLHVLMGHPSGLRDNAYFYKRRSDDPRLPGPSSAGPVWDFGATAGSRNAAVRRHDVWSTSDEASGFFVRTPSNGLPRWWHLLFQQPDFQQAWIDRWHQLRKEIFHVDAIGSVIDEMTGTLGDAPVRNFQRWPEFADASLFGPGGEVDGLKYWLEGRVRWIDRQLIPLPALRHVTREPGGAVTMELVRPERLGNSGEVFFTTDGTDPRLPGGALSPQAKPAGSHELGWSTTVIARSRAEHHPTEIGGPGFMKWSAPLVKRFYVGHAAPDFHNVRVSEIMFHPPEPTPEEYEAGFEDDDDFEYIELWNPTDESVDLTGVRLAEPVGIAFEEGVTLDAGERALLVKSIDAFHFRYGEEARVLGEYVSEGTLSNKRGSIAVVALEGDVLFTIDYHDHIDETDGDGHSLVLQTSGLEKWTASRTRLGTPGEVDRFLDLPISYVGWIFSAFPADLLDDETIVGWDSDPDGDGWANHTEFAFATDPLERNGCSFRFDTTGMGSLATVSHPARDEGVWYAVETSSDLRLWKPAESSTTAFVENGLTWYRHKIGSLFIPAKSPLFVRLRYDVDP